MSCSTPGIVASASFTAQTAIFGPTTIYTPAAAGLFRVSMYLETGDASNSNVVRATFNYTDDYNAQSQGASTIGGAAALAPITQVIRSASSVAMTVTTSSGGNPLATPYDLYVTIEAL